MRIIAKHAAGKVLKSDGFQISADAKLAKKKDPSIIDGTLGTFYFEDGSFKTFQTVHKIMNQLNDEDIYLYSTSDGGPAFKEAILEWAFKHTRKEIEASLSVAAIPTPGGTGALTSAVFNSLDPQETLLIPSPCWGPYVGIALNRAFKIEKFFMFDGDAFNMKGFIEKSEKIIAAEGKLVVIINDPCNNPTGYNMTKAELEAVIDYLNTKKEVPCVLIYDCAYIDMAVEGMKKTRENMLAFTKANENILISVAFSFSKTFFIYGQRLGGQILLSKNKESVIEYYNAANYTARNTWSNCNKGMIRVLEEMTKSPALMAEYQQELDEVIAVLNTRAELFKKEAKQVGLQIYPYQGGFFITIPCDNNMLVLEKLVEEEKIYLLPFDNSVRVAICSLPQSDLKGLAEKIHRVIKKYN
ncbi:MAG: aminotransferase class I/II-fold pyridoxal phosphate-dependent enzyme [Bacilli bacterium]|jgi:aspartate/tyrosine/aromatic aminotransferase|nr:aminotransferase class I/II-fold pyridoxal phosphate-dependent enzyme [Bacilli bacterium]